VSLIGDEEYGAIEIEPQVEASVSDGYCDTCKEKTANLTKF
jgi:hypothetical protein